MINEDLKGKRVGVYGRVSTEEQKEGKTIESQIEALVKLANDSGALSVELYKDEGSSGGSLARPALDRLRDDGKEGRLDVVLVNDVDRMARDVVHLGIIKRDLERNGVVLVFRNAPMAGEGPWGNLMLNVLGSFAQFERAIIMDRTRRGKYHKAHKGKLVGHRAPYGFRYVPKDRTFGRERDGYLELVPEKIKVVKQIFKWALEGISLNMILRKVNQLGVLSPRGDKAWGRSSVYNILHDEAYCAMEYYGVSEMYHRPGIDDDTGRKTGRRVRPKEEWIPIPLAKEFQIIPLDIFEAVQRQLQRNRQLHGRNNTKREYLLRGLIKCEICGYAVVGAPEHSGEKYMCSKSRSTFHPLPKKCPLGGIRCHVIDDIVWGGIKEAVLNPEFLINQIEQKKKRIETSSTKSPQEKVLLEKGLLETKQEEDRLLGALRVGAISLDQLQSQMNGVRQRRIVLEKDLAEWSGKKETIPAAVMRRGIEEWCKKVEERLDKMDFEERKSFLQKLIDRINLGVTKLKIKALIPLSESDALCFANTQRWWCCHIPLLP